MRTTREAHRREQNPVAWWFITLWVRAIASTVNDFVSLNFENGQKSVTENIHRCDFTAFLLGPQAQPGTNCSTGPSHATHSHDPTSLWVFWQRGTSGTAQ